MKLSFAPEMMKSMQIEIEISQYPKEIEKYRENVKCLDLDLIFDGRISNYIVKGMGEFSYSIELPKLMCGPRPHILIELDKI